MTFLFAILLSGAAQAATILVWGDSLSTGYGLRPKEDWPSLLQTRLVREGFRHTIVNGSVSGETTAGGRTRLSAALDRHKPDLLILELGANDGLRGLQPALMGENLSAMIQAARGKGANVLLVGMQLPPNYGHTYNSRFQQAFVEVARSENIPFIPFLLDGFAHKQEMFQPDGIHPTAEAQPLMLETVWKGLRGLLKD